MIQTLSRTAVGSPALLPPAAANAALGCISPATHDGEMLLPSPSSIKVCKKPEKNAGCSSKCSAVRGHGGARGGAEQSPPPERFGAGQALLRVPAPTPLAGGGSPQQSPVHTQLSRSELFWGLTVTRRGLTASISTRHRVLPKDEAFLPTPCHRSSLQRAAAGGNPSSLYFPVTAACPT